MSSEVEYAGRIVEFHFFPSRLPFRLPRVDGAEVEFLLGRQHCPYGRSSRVIEWPADAPLTKDAVLGRDLGEVFRDQVDLFGVDPAAPRRSHLLDRFAPVGQWLSLDKCAVETMTVATPDLGRLDGILLESLHAAIVGASQLGALGTRVTRVVIRAGNVIPLGAQIDPYRKEGLFFVGQRFIGRAALDGNIVEEAVSVESPNERRFASHSGIDVLADLGGGGRT